jgi:hypothetical protein
MNGSESCTSLQGAKLNISAVDFPSASSIQLAILRLLQVSTYIVDTSSVINLGIKANDMLRATGIAQSLPDDQWLQELVAWESHVWAGLQMAVSDYAIGIAARDAAAASFVRNDTDAGEKQLCQSQRMRMAGGFV